MYTLEKIIFNTSLFSRIVVNQFNRERIRQIYNLSNISCTTVLNCQFDQFCKPLMEENISGSTQLKFGSYFLKYQEFYLSK